MLSFLPNYKTEFNMIKSVNVNNFKQVKSIINTATKCKADINVTDIKGSIANAKSILGLMSLDYSKPVTLESDNEAAIKDVMVNLKKN